MGIGHPLGKYPVFTPVAYPENLSGGGQSTKSSPGMKYTGNEFTIMNSTRQQKIPYSPTVPIGAVGEKN